MNRRRSRTGGVGRRGRRPDNISVPSDNISMGSVVIERDPPPPLVPIPGVDGRPYEPTPPPKHCRASIPVEIEVSVDVRPLCYPMSSEEIGRFPRRGPRRKGGLDMIETVDDQNVESNIQDQSLTVLQDILKKQRTILQGLSSPSNPPGPPERGRRRMSVGGGGRNYQQRNVPADDKEESNDQGDSSQMEYDHNESNPRRMFDEERRQRRHHRERGGGRHDRRETAAAAADFSADETDGQSLYEHEGAKGRLKGGMTEPGIPDDVKKDALLKGMNMCRPTVHASHLIELFNRRKIKESNNAKDTMEMEGGMSSHHLKGDKIKKKSKSRLRGGVETLQSRYSRSMAKINCYCGCSKKNFKKSKKKLNHENFELHRNKKLNPLPIENWIKHGTYRKSDITVNEYTSPEHIETPIHPRKILKLNFDDSFLSDRLRSNQPNGCTKKTNNDNGNLELNHSFSDKLANVEQEEIIFYYRNVIKESSCKHKPRKLRNPLETLEQVSEKLTELSRFGKKLNDRNEIKIPLRCYYAPELTNNKIKRRKNRRYYEINRKFKDYSTSTQCSDL